MTPGEPSAQDRSGGTLLFGGGPESEQVGGERSAGVLPAPRAVQDSPRSAARRARQRRRAAQRRSRVRMRAGSEVLLAFLVLLGLTLLLIDTRTDGGAFAAPRAWATAVFGPMQAGIDAATDPAAADAALQAENEQLRAQLKSSAADRARLAELEQLLGLTSSSRAEVVVASVVAHDSGPGGAAGATIDRGSDDGIVADQAVLASGGLVGLVRAAAPSSAVVRFVTDAGFVAGGRLQASGEAGIVRGGGSPGRMTMELLNPLAAVERGDVVVTYGSPGDGPFPAGLVIGTVTDPGDAASAKRVVTLEPATDPSTVSAVAVILAVRPAEAPVVEPSEGEQAAPSDSRDSGEQRAQVQR